MIEISQPLVKHQLGIFLSSTNDPEVRKYRMAARDVIEEEEFREKWYPQEMDSFTPSASTSLKECEKVVLSCFVYIGILGPFYGSLVPDLEVSYTEYEYSVAQKENREIGIFMLPDEVLKHSPSEITFEQGPLFARQKEFKDRLNSQHMTRSVNNIDDFKHKLRHYIRNKLNATTFVVVAPSISDKPVAEFPGLETFDRKPVPHSFKLQDLDQRLISEYLNSQMAVSALDEREVLHASDEDHLKLLGVLNADGRPTFGVFMCFAPYSLLVNKFGACSLHMVMYSGTTTSSRVEYKREVEDNLLNLHKRGMKFFRSDAGLKRLGEVGTFDRDELEIPTLALREALGNALVHRDYSREQFREQPTRIEVYSDRIEIISFGGLAEGITEENLNTSSGDVISRRRNPIIAKIFMYMQLVEMSGSGIKRIHDIIQQVGLPKPKIEESADKSTIKITFYRAKAYAHTKDKKYVFISYSRSDKHVMRSVVNSLMSSSISVWTDESMEPGTPSWQGVIEQGISEASAVVAIMSPEAKNSRWVRAELAYAQQMDLPIYLVLATGDQRQSIPLGFVNHQYFDLRSNPQNIEKLIFALQSRMSG